jgi:hypothetical protein
MTHDYICECEIGGWTEWQMAHDQTVGRASMLVYNHKVGNLRMSIQSLNLKLLTKSFTSFARHASTNCLIS